jgi:hypothetical protein
MLYLDVQILKWALVASAQQTSSLLIDQTKSHMLSQMLHVVS